MDVEELPSVSMAGSAGSDPRWQLIERILRTIPFQKSTRLPALLQFLAKHSLEGNGDSLTEQKIGVLVFGKANDYSPTEDSAVRVYARQLRLRLHEYFDSEGREEPITIEMPKGSYSLVFHSSLRNPDHQIATVPFEVASESVVKRKPLSTWLLWTFIISTFLCGYGWFHSASSSSEKPLAWPLSAVVQAHEQTTIVLADSNSMLRLLDGKPILLDDYLDPDYLHKRVPIHMDEGEARLVKYISDSQLTSIADVFVTSTILRLAGTRGDNFTIRSARDINRRDLKQGNFIFVGSPTSNPWVSLFEDKLNFKVVEDGVGGQASFQNRRPKPGEQAIYKGPEYTGTSGQDYATIALLPNADGGGSVLIIQGLRQEGTEAGGMLLANAAAREQLQHVLAGAGGSNPTNYFEALIQTRSVGGAPVSFEVIATRLIKP